VCCAAAVLLTCYVCVGFWIGDPSEIVINILPFLLIFLKKKLIIIYSGLRAIRGPFGPAHIFCGLYQTGRKNLDVNSG
jgi:hypothetical protein